MTTKRRTNNHHPVRTIIVTFILLLLFIVGLVFVFNEPIKQYMVSQMSQKTMEQPLDKKTTKTAQAFAKGKPSAQQQKEYKDFEVSYQLDKVKPLSIQDVTKERMKHKKVPMLGKIAVPSVRLCLPIVPGVSNASLSTGAGTLKKDDQMGVGNFALASHNMNDYTTLFSPLLNVKVGAKMYVTNGDRVYVYTVKTKRYIAPTEVQVIDNHQKSELTLITCSLDGSKRLLVQGPLVQTTSYNQYHAIFE